MLDKDKLKAIADKLGIKVTFDSNKPGFLSENNKEFYSFSDLDKIIDKAFPINESIDKKAPNQKQKILSSLVLKSGLEKTKLSYISPIKTFPLKKKSNKFNKKFFDTGVISYSNHQKNNASINIFDAQIEVFNKNNLNSFENCNHYYNVDVKSSNYNKNNCLEGVFGYEQ